MRKRQREGTLERVVKYDVEAFKTAWDYLADEEEEAAPPPLPWEGVKTAIFGLTHFFSAVGACRVMHEKKKKMDSNPKNVQDLKKNIA